LACGLEAGRNAALSFRARLSTDARFVLPIAEPELDIVFWAAAAPSPGDSSTRARAIFEEARKRNLYLAHAELPTRFFPADTWPTPPAEGTHVTCLRSVLMKPEHEPWIDEIWHRFQLAASAAR
jgi:hypothetical protein